MNLFGVKVSKTKLVAVVAGLLTTLQMVGVIHLDPKQLEAILTILGAGGLYSLRDAIGK